MLTAELAVLTCDLAEDEEGLWMNSRSRTSGVKDLAPCMVGSDIAFRAVRASLPVFAVSLLERLFAAAHVAKGCPDLVIWCSVPQSIRLVEVKCPHWDTVSREQECFMFAAAALGIPAKTMEWEFADETS